MSRNTLVLGIETSCDETAAAVVDGARRIHSNVVHSQIAAHTPYGGVVPEIAARAHLAVLPDLVAGAMRQAMLGLALSPDVAVSFSWVKGHSGDRWNDRGDELATQAADSGTGTSG